MCPFNGRECSGKTSVCTGHWVSMFLRQLLKLDFKLLCWGCGVNVQRRLAENNPRCMQNRVQLTYRNIHNAQGKICRYKYMQYYIYKKGAQAVTLYIYIICEIGGIWWNILSWHFTQFTHEYNIDSSKEFRCRVHLTPSLKHILSMGESVIWAICKASSSSSSESTCLPLHSPQYGRPF